MLSGKNGILCLFRVRKIKFHVVVIIFRGNIFKTKTYEDRCPMHFRRGGEHSRDTRLLKGTKKQDKYKLLIRFQLEVISHD